jgi:predicted peptidase
MCEIKELSLGDFNCLAFFPKGFDQSKKYPVIFHLHGAGSRGNDVSVLNNQAILVKAKSTEDFPFVIIMPQCNEDCWIDAYERLKVAVELAVNLPFTDKNRFYLSGVSMGGYASWQLLMSMPDRFTAAIICCGGGMVWNAVRVKTPVWAFHGTDDQVVHIEENERLVNAIKRNGVTAKFTAYPGVQHNSWDLTYSRDDVYEWLLGFTF